MSPRTKAIRAYPDLKTWRRAQGFNTRDAAEFLGISQSTYSRIERGIQPAKGHVAKRLMEETGVSLEILVGVA